MITASKLKANQFYQRGVLRETSLKLLAGG